MRIGVGLVAAAMLAVLTIVTANAQETRFKLPDTAAMERLLAAPQSSRTQPADTAMQLENELNKFEKALVENARRLSETEAATAAACTKACDAIKNDAVKAFVSGKILHKTLIIEMRKSFECKKGCAKK